MKKMISTTELKKEVTELSDLIKEMIEYIMDVETTIDYEYEEGKSRNFEELLEDAKAEPKEVTEGILLYYKLKKLLDKR